MIQPKSHILVIFGASGDLTYRKLIPSIWDLFEQNHLPNEFAVLGLGRTELSDSDFRIKMTEGIQNFAMRKPVSKEQLRQFADKLYYFAFNPLVPQEYNNFKAYLLKLDQQHNTQNNFIYYLATPPNLYGVVPEELAKQGLSNEDEGFKRLIIEKPFGYNLESAQKLNSQLLQFFNEEQIYRIDHYLGKETVQNLLVTRFSNSIFEPLWNRNYIHHVEITSSENIGVENRGGYYEDSGALRDMVQNHLLLLAGLVAMEPPVLINSNSIRNEIVKVFQSFRPIKVEEVEKYVVRGQYLSSVIKGKSTKGYREEKGVDPKSRTETFVAMKFFIDNWRWAGVPFYIRTGKMLPTRVTEIVIHFNKSPHHLFADDKNLCNQQNQLVIRIQPDEGLLLKFDMKVPGAGFNAQTVNMDFHYSSLSDSYLPSAYERLLLDCMQGDNTLFMQGEAVEETWRFVQPILDYWDKHPEAALYGYPAGSWGPDVADNLIEGAGNTWRYPCKNLADDGVYCEL